MKPIGRRMAVLAVFSGMIALLLCMPAVGNAQTYRADIELTTKDAASRETMLGNVITDAVRASAKSDAALMIASFFNDATIPKGTFSAGDVLKALVDKSDNIVIMKLTGDQVRRALEHGLSLYPNPIQQFLQTSGLTVTINPNADNEKRLVSVKIGGETLDAGKTYRVAMPAPLANGTQGYFKIWKKSDIEKDTGKTLENAITDYLNEHKTLVKGEDRLVIKK